MMEVGKPAIVPMRPWRKAGPLRTAARTKIDRLSPSVVCLQRHALAESFVDAELHRIEVRAAGAVHQPDGIERRPIGPPLTNVCSRRLTRNVGGRVQFLSLQELGAFGSCISDTEQPVLNEFPLNREVPALQIAGPVLFRPRRCREAAWECNVFRRRERHWEGIGAEEWILEWARRRPQS